MALPHYSPQGGSRHNVYAGSLVGSEACLCWLSQTCFSAPFIYGLHFNLFLIAYLTHLAIKVKWRFDKCECF